MSYMSLDRRCYRHSLTFHHGGDKTAINTRQKKKRSYGFATFKKKLIGKRRHCKGSDHGRCFREHFVDCSSDILKALLGQYEALTVLKDLSVQADLARPPAQTIGQNLAELLDSESCCDIVLVYHGQRISAHRNILMARCPYFSRHLAFSQTDEFHLRTRGVVVPLTTLKCVLKYLYTGNADLLATQAGDAIAMLEDEFGIPNSLESDVSFLLETGSLADCRLLFGNDVDGYNTEIMCHKTVVAARSAFLRRLIERRTKSDPSLQHSTIDIRLDSKIIPANYARVILHAMYVDSLDFRLITPPDGSSQDQMPGAAANTSVNNSAGLLQPGQAEDYSQDAMNLYEIGKFLEFHFLAQSCEDVLMQLLSVHNVNKILAWSLNSYGSAWIARQAYQYLEEEFYSVNNSDVLACLDQDTMCRILKSDFLQASESEVLQALVRWGEHQLSNKNEAKECLSGSATLTRKAPKRREVCDSELKELLSTIIPQVRISHVLPRDRTSEVLDMALARNLFSVLPNFSSQVNSSTKYSPWDPRSNNGLFVRPRLFLPYFEECKKLIQDRCAQDPEIISSSSPCVGVPDTLYMLKSRRNDGDTDLVEFQTSKLPDKEMVTRMLERLKKLLNSASVQRALSSHFIDPDEVLHLVELRVVREYNLPDNYAAFLHKSRSRSASGDWQERGIQLSSRVMYCPNDGRYHPPLDDPAVLSNSSNPGPDVTLASNALSTLSLQSHEQDSPDVVTIGETGVTTVFSRGGAGRHQWKLPHAAAHHQQGQQHQKAITRMPHSYCTGPSHMYL